MMEPGYGHLNCTFSFAQRLKVEGYEVFYIVPENFYKVIEKQGFQVKVGNPQLFQKGTESSFLNLSLVDRMFHRLVDYIFDIQVEYTRKAANKINELVLEVKPDLLFLDSFLSMNYFFLKTPKPKIILLQIMFATKKRQGIPPLNCYLLPQKRDNKFNSFDVRLAWWKYFFKRRLDSFLRLKTDYISTTKKVLRHEKTIKKELDYSYAFRPSVKGLDEFILAPKTLDFDEINPIRHLYLASSIKAHREEAMYGGKLGYMLEYLNASAREKNWVYCSLGTLNMTHNRHCLRFFKNIIKVFCQQPNWELILSTGEIQAKHFGHQPPNIHLFDRVPQLEVLNYCKVMVTHGGINSVLECVNTCTPMIVFPLNKSWDQSGNAARVVHYGLGLHGNLENHNSDNIQAQLETLFNTDTYLNNLQKIRAKIYTEQGTEKAIEILKKIISNETYSLK